MFSLVLYPFGLIKDDNILVVCRLVHWEISKMVLLQANAKLKVKKMCLKGVDYRSLHRLSKHISTTFLICLHHCVRASNAYSLDHVEIKQEPASCSAS